MTDFDATDLEIQNFATADDLLGDSGDEETFEGLVHIRVQQRNGRKTLTTCQGLPDSAPFTKLLKGFKKKFCCNGTIVEDEDLGKVIQLQGDHRENIKTLLVRHKIVQKKNIKVHGF
mmetsp:Transcript_24428/g.27082  ORF Transcript_24428/g.27082 Transcript_24428/m.27082 type:complete len:117 (-) Transcript_24428:25-375(-)